MPSGLRVGLTGGIASGKSTVAQRFMELGVPVIDADESARRVVVKGTAGWARVAERFGAEILAADGSIDRRALRQRVFADARLRLELESLLHPLIREDMERRASVSHGPYLVLAIPLLIEGGSRDRIHRTLVIDVGEDIQIERLMARDGATRAEAEAVLAAQTSRASRLAAADDVLANAGTVVELRRGVDQLHQRYLSLADSWAEDARHT